MQRYFIIGTDTDCGKTYVTRKLMDSVENSVAIKPIASGCMEKDGDLISADAQVLQKNSPLTLEQINPWRFSSPVSPHIAAKLDGVRISIQDIADYCLQFDLPDTDTLFIEGAGGLMVPLNDEETWVDFLRLTKIPVILVVGMRLGCINHAFLTAKVLEQFGIECKGWIANCIDPGMLFLKENINTLIKGLKMPLLDEIPFDINRL